MMTLSAQNEQLLNRVESNCEAVNCNENHYIYLSNELSIAYRKHLFDCLENGEGMVISEVDFEDSERYADKNRRNTQTVRPLSATSAAMRESVKPRERTVKTFDRRKTAILVMYAVMVIAIVTTLILTVPGTAWEQESVTFPPVTSEVAIAAGSNLSIQDQGLDVIMTDEGPVTVTLEPYAETEQPNTNWFDKLCDWVSNVVGG